MGDDWRMGGGTGGIGGDYKIPYVPLYKKKAYKEVKVVGRSKAWTYVGKISCGLILILYSFPQIIM